MMTPEHAQAVQQVEIVDAMAPVRAAAGRLGALAADLDRACQLGDTRQVLEGGQQLLQEFSGFGAVFRAWIGSRPDRPGWSPSKVPAARREPGSDDADRSST